jgi:hypothetical protein
MESPALVAAVAAGAGAAAMLLLVTAVLAVTGRRRSRADLEAMLVEAQRETESLRQRLDELAGDGRAASGGAAAPAAADPAFVITHVGEPEDTADQLPVSDRLVLSATLGEPLVKVAAFSHGLRRALSAESRNRIWFEMRREMRASRRRRRALRKRLEREYRANLRAAEDIA